MHPLDMLDDFFGFLRMLAERDLREYTPLRIATISGNSTPEDEARINARTNALQTRMRQAAKAVARREPTTVSVSMMTTLNETFDLSLTSRRNFTTHVPSYILRRLLIVDIDSPRHGGVTLDPAPLVWTLQGFGPPPP